MLGRLVIGTVVGAGLLAIALGVQRWFDAQAAAATLHTFMEAVEAGDRAAALSLLTPERRRLLEARLADDSSASGWKPQPGVDCELRDLTISGDTAVATLHIEKNGFMLKPLIRLRRGATSRWKIDRIENLKPDPRFREQQRAFARRQGEQIADRLQQALQDRPGIAVERVVLPELPTRR